MTTADWKIEPQKTRGKTANRAARVFIAGFYSGNIARVHSSVRFHFSEIQSYYSLFLQVPTFTSHLPTHEECTPCDFCSRFIRGQLDLFALCSRDCAFSAQIQRKSRKVSVKVSANFHLTLLYFVPRPTPSGRNKMFLLYLGALNSHKISAVFLLNHQDFLCNLDET